MDQTECLNNKRSWRRAGGLMNMYGDGGTREGKAKRRVRGDAKAAFPDVGGKHGWESCPHPDTGSTTSSGLST